MTHRRPIVLLNARRSQINSHLGSLVDKINAVPLRRLNAAPLRRLQQVTPPAAKPALATATPAAAPAAGTKQAQPVTAEGLQTTLNAISTGTKTAVDLYNETKGKVSKVRSSITNEQAWVKNNLKSFVKSSQDAMTNISKLTTDINTAFNQQLGKIDPASGKTDLGVPLTKDTANAKEIIDKAKQVEEKLKKFWDIAKIGTAKANELRIAAGKTLEFVQGNAKKYFDSVTSKMNAMDYKLPEEKPAAPAATAKPAPAAAAAPAAKTAAKAPAKKRLLLKLPSKY